MVGREVVECLLIFHDHISFFLRHETIRHTVVIQAEHDTVIAAESDRHLIIYIAYFRFLIEW